MAKMTLLFLSRYHFLFFRARRSRLVAMGEIAEGGTDICRVRESEEGYVSVAERTGTNVTIAKCWQDA